jgi:hypothetical protein
MARQYKIITPDGAEMMVEGPEDATDDELVAFAQAQIASAKPKYAKDRVQVRRPEQSIAPAADAPALSPGATRLKAAQDALGGRSAIGTALQSGALGNLSDEWAGVVNAGTNILASPFTGDLNPSQAYRDARDLERYNMSQAADKMPVGNALGQVVGGFLGMAPAAAGGVIMDALSSIKAGAKGGAIGGAITGFGSGEDAETSAVGGVLGGAFGGVLGGAVPALVNYARPVIQGTRRLLGRDQPGLARQIVADALASDANTGASAGAMMDRAHALGVPYMLADTGENTRGLVASVGRQPGASRTTVLNAVNERQRGQADRIRGAIERDLGPITNQPERVAAAQGQARATAREATERATLDLTQAAESVGPNVDRLASGGQAREAFGSAYDAARARTRSAYEVPELTTPQPIEIPSELFARDLRSASDDFYGDGGGEIPAALRAIIDDAAAPDATTRTLTNIDRRLADFGGEAAMSGNRSDAAFATRVRGLLSDFADRAAPADYRAALANAKSVRAEQGRLFESRDVPRAFARDRYGNPLVGDTSVPERLVRPGAPGGDTADDLIASIGPEAAEATMRQELRRNLDALPNLTPANTRALNTRYAEMAQRFPSLRSDLDAVNWHAANVAGLSLAEREAGREGSTALERGWNGLTQSPDEIARNLSLSDDVAGFGEGFRNRLADQVSRRVDDADKARALIGSPQRRGVLEQVFPGEDLDRFGETLAAEQAANQTFRSATQGSQTAERLAYDAQTADPGIAETGFEAVLRGSQGNMWQAVVSGLQKARETSRFGVGEAGKSVRQSVATLLTETDPVILRQVLEAANADVLARQAAAGGIARAGAQAGRGLTIGTVGAVSNLGR